MCRNPALAEQRQRKRQELLAATENDLMPFVTATQRAKEPLRGAAAIGVRVGKVINRHKVSKHFITTITDDSFSFARGLDKIATEEELDGLYIVRSNVEPELFDAEQTVAAYKDLAKVERAFRSMKTADLKVRPIYYLSPQRRPGTGARVPVHAGLRCRGPMSSTGCRGFGVPFPTRSSVAPRAR